jgi:CheY-like chemotaxis protein
MATILTLEDDWITVKLLNGLLDDNGHQSITAVCITEAWDRLTNYPLVDMVVLDNELDDERGWDFLADLRKDLLFQPLPVVVYTARSDRASVTKYISLGVQNFLLKPYKWDKLAAEIERAVQRRWITERLEEVDSVCSRFGISQGVYFDTVSELATELKSVRERVVEHIEAKDYKAIFGAVHHFKSSGSNLGLHVLKDVVEEIRIACEKGDEHSLREMVGRMPALTKLLEGWVALKKKEVYR